VFMAARFDASRAAELNQATGDGTPIMLTIPTDDPWVPLRILGLGLQPTELVQADVFLLTPDRPQLLAGDEGLALQRSERASTGLLDDLRSDKGMGWVPPDMWLTYLSLDVNAGALDYDLAISVHDDQAPSPLAAGIADASILGGPGFDYGWALPIGAAGLGAAFAAFVWSGRRARRDPSGGIAA